MACFSLAENEEARRCGRAGSGLRAECREGVYPAPGDMSEPVAHTAGLLGGLGLHPARPELLCVHRAGGRAPEEWSSARDRERWWTTETALSIPCSPRRDHLR